MESPLFIFSLPRAGSTLLQRVLMSHNEICSLSEPWLLLPQIYALKQEGTLSEYSSFISYHGISDFIGNLPDKKQDYYESLNTFITDLYSKQCKSGEKYFLDKTPRYYLIIDEILEIFPNAKFIFLFRNPIQIYASIINTWGNRRFKKLYSTYYDIIDGTKLLSAGYEKHKDKSIAVSYENFINDPTSELIKITSYLDIEFHSTLLERFSKQDTKGNLGDSTGAKDYISISSDSLNKWKNTFNSFIRKKYAIILLNQIEDKDLLIQNYSKTDILLEINKLDNKKNKYIFIDVFDFFVSFFVRKTSLYLFFKENFSWVKSKSIS